jgi:hypothetical protein
MLGDRIDVQVDVQEKWDVVNNEFRARMKSRGPGSGSNLNHLFRNSEEENGDEEMLSEYENDGGTSEEEMN